MYSYSFIALGNIKNFTFRIQRHFQKCGHHSPCWPWKDSKNFILFEKTLVDALLRASGCANEYDSMDSNALEKEKGITILSKVTGVTFGGNKINIVDTPGH